MIILRIGFEVRLQVVDSIGEYGDLHLGGTRVARCVAYSAINCCFFSLVSIFFTSLSSCSGCSGKTWRVGR